MDSNYRKNNILKPIPPVNPITFLREENKITVDMSDIEKKWLIKQSFINPFWYVDWPESSTEAKNQFTLKN